MFNEGDKPSLANHTQNLVNERRGDEHPLARCLAKIEGIQGGKGGVETLLSQKMRRYTSERGRELSLTTKIDFNIISIHKYYTVYAH